MTKLSFPPLFVIPAKLVPEKPVPAKPVPAKAGSGNPEVYLSFPRMRESRGQIVLDSCTCYPLSLAQASQVQAFTGMTYLKKGMTYLKKGISFCKTGMTFCKKGINFYN